MRSPSSLGVAPLLGDLGATSVPWSPIRSIERKRMKAELGPLRGDPTTLFGEVAFTDPDRIRGDFNQLIVIDPLD